MTKNNSKAAPTGADQRSHFLRLSPGKLSGLRRITDLNDRFKVLALDQSNSFKKALRAMHEKAGRPAEPTTDEILHAKLLMVKVLAPHASAVLLDVPYGARQSVHSWDLPRNAGLIVRLETSKDAGLPADYEPGVTVETIKRMGAAAVKLLLYIDALDKKNADSQIAFLKRVSRECQESDILLMTEELSFPRQGEDKSSPAYLSRKVENIIESARLIGPYTDILKLEFPGDIDKDSPDAVAKNLSELNSAAIRPWVLLSAGAKFEVFVRQTELAMKAGASGYMAGRAIFNEYFTKPSPEERRAFLDKDGQSRMETLNRIIDAHAVPWPRRCGLTHQEMAAAVDPEWHLKAAGLAKASQPRAAAAVKGDY